MAQFGDGQIPGIDVGEAQRLLGGAPAAAARQLNELRDLIKREGYASETAGSLELTPRGTRMIGQRALAEIFRSVKRQGLGNHRPRASDGRANDSRKRSVWSLEIRSTCTWAERS